jgi:hypothetical protein
MDFQRSIAVTPAIGIPGDFASVNPRQHLVSGTTDQVMVADSAGVTMGRFGILNANGTVTEKPLFANVSATRVGFVHRVIGAALITTWLGESTNLIPPGRGVELFSHGDFFAVADAITGTPVRGARVIWNPVTGTINIGAAVGAATVDTGFVLLSETATAGATVMIGRQNPVAVGTA